jgi:RimJ/RimL family protein N-acetyltransferase
VGAEAPTRGGQRRRGADGGLTGRLRIRTVARADVTALRDVRLRALESDPDAFGSTVERERARSDDEWEAWAAASEEGVEQRTFAIVDDRDGPDAPFRGLAMVARDADHVGGAAIYSMWVAPETRGQGSALFLCQSCAWWAVERDLRTLRLAVFAENPRARRAYANAGFSVEGSAVIRTGDGRVLEELRLVQELPEDGRIV